MGQTFFPFDSGAGGNVAENQWSLMAKNWLATGVLKGILNEFQVYADSTGMQAKVKSGNAWIQGHFFQSDAEVIMPISTANATNPRIDRVILRVDWTANTITINVLTGTAASSPAAPAVTQNTNFWEISLAQVYVTANVSTIAAGNITDERDFVRNTKSFKNKPHLHIELSGTYTLNNAADTPLFTANFNVTSNNGGWTHNINNWIAPSAGVYNITAFLVLQGVPVASELKCEIVKYDTSGNNPIIYVVGDAISSNASKWLYADGSMNLYLKAGEQISLNAYQDGGTANLQSARLTAVLVHEY